MRCQRWTGAPVSRNGLHLLAYDDASRAGQGWLAIEGRRDGLHEAEIVHEQALLADEEIAIRGDVEIINRLGCVGLDRRDFNDSTHHANPIARFQVAGHCPAFAGFPETMNAGRHDGFAFDSDFQGGRRLVEMSGGHGLEDEKAGGRILRQDAVSDLERIDRNRSVNRMNQSAGCETRRVRPDGVGLVQGNHRRHIGKARLLCDRGLGGRLA